MYTLTDLLCVLDEEGGISTFNTSKNPSELLGHWSSPNRRLGKYTVMALYETAMDKVHIILFRDLVFLFFMI